MSRENDVKRACIRLYESFGAQVWPHSEYRMVKVRAGYPDLTVLLPRGLGVLYHEVKGDGGVQSEAQREFQEACRMSGAGYVLGGLDEAIAALQAIGLSPGDMRGAA